MAADDPAARIAAHRAEIARLEGEIDELRREMGEQPGVSPFAPWPAFPVLPAVAGVRFAAVNAGVRYTTGRLDVMLAELAPGSVMAGTFTRSATRAAPVLWCEERIAEGGTAERGALAIVVNAGNANAFTGSNGADSVRTVMEATGSVWAWIPPMSTWRPPA